MTQDPGQRSPQHPESDGPAQDSLGRTLAASYGASGTFRRDEQGRIDLRHAVGGWRGMLESVLPSLVFLVVYLITQHLAPALWVAVAAALAAALLRLAQRGGLLQSLAGAAGVLVCAGFARFTGQAADYFVPGFWINGLYLLGAVISMAARWPVIGLFYGFLRGEGTAWRSRPERLRAYQWATVVFAGMLALRLAVQLPLYAADLVGPLGAARIVMGTPFYILVLWLGWLISRPATAPDRGPSDRGPEPA
ncbi:MAG: DUF3159 domain-containing protein [Actinomycetia bacterium]|nr:DUF3159 domain-containing protein [Actinomycetes bacterium]